MVLKWALVIIPVVGTLILGTVWANGHNVYIW
jgi:hypothetical protein